MATAFTSFRAPIVSSAAPSNPRNRKNTAAADQSNSWGAPIFGWPSEPDYINCSVKLESGQEAHGRPEKKMFRGYLTEEKARELRRMTIETSNFHDVMYHSTIASRLASDVSGS